MPDLTQYQGQPLSPQEKKQYLLNKYVKRDYKVEDLYSCKKYVVYFNPALDKIKEWTLISVCSTLEEARQEIFWRMCYLKNNDTEIVIDHDPRFSTWKNELLNIDPKTNQPYEHGEGLMKMDYNSSGNMLQVIANSAPTQNNSNNYRGLAYYASQEIPDYRGTYKIEEIYQI